MNWTVVALLVALGADPLPSVDGPRLQPSRFAAAAVTVERPPAPELARSAFGGPARTGVAAVPSRPPVPRAEDRWFGRDKWMHFAVSAVIQAVGYGVALGSESHAASLRIGGASVAVIGLGREVYDWWVKDRFSTKDLVWDALGGATAGVALHQVR
jgi:uncharacterized protein YfiM (DUF2279 family)